MVHHSCHVHAVRTVHVPLRMTLGVDSTPDLRIGEYTSVVQ